MKHVGIKNVYSVFNLLIIIFFLVSLLFTIRFWVYVDSDLYAGSMAQNGKEVEAKITDFSYIERTDDDNTYYSYWQTFYTYVDADGRSYSGGAYSFRSRGEAESVIGDKITVTVNPKTGESSMLLLDYFEKEKDGLYVHFIHACVISPFFLFFVFELFYRVIYWTSLNKKIVKNLKSGFIARGTIDGEVVKTAGLIWFYVRIKFTDDFGIAHEKWSGDLFTRREAKFLSKKKYVKIVPYKKIYGIMEEMPSNNRKIVNKI